jgi:hypothetical protein
VFETNEMNEGIETKRNARPNWGLRAAAVAVVAVLACVTAVVYRTDNWALPRRSRAAVLASLWVIGGAAVLAVYKFAQARRLAEDEPDHATPEHVFVPEAVAQAAAEEAAAQAAAQAEEAETTAAQIEVTPAAQEVPVAIADAETPAAASRIYWTKSGKTYHVCRACTALARSKEVREGSLPDALAAGKKSACNYCAGANASSKAS